MTERKRVLVCVGTRPEAIKLFPVILALKADPRFECRVCATAQHREMLDQVLRLAAVAPDRDLDLMRPGQTLTSITTGVLETFGPVLEAEHPDWVVVQGDTTTAMAGALAAFYRKVPVAHVEAGLRTGNMHAPFPEEANRRLVGVLASLHFAPTERARAALLAENVAPQRVVVTGNTVVDALLATRAQLGAHAAETAALRAALPAAGDSRRVILVTAHRRENLDGGMERIAAALRTLADRGDTFVAFPVHPNPRVRGPMEAMLGDHPSIALLPPLDYLPFIAALDRCDFVLTDSGGVQEEAPSFGKPVLVMRDVTERPEAVEAGTSRLVGSQTERILAEATRLLDDPAAHAAMRRAHNPYGDGRAAERIRDALANAPP
ncbi:MAG: UDP-N-acetylglucosamine 2-epimerase (non-hydrolyzing) [Acetobacteraceae bacterium]|nr:UDP-N-acetylglucosamine 2-epimerase (non-hydrolyzing) [Acetobacteraceae bacterium]